MNPPPPTTLCPPSLRHHPPEPFSTAARPPPPITPSPSLVLHQNGWFVQERPSRRCLPLLSTALARASDGPTPPAALFLSRTGATGMAAHDPGLQMRAPRPDVSQHWPLLPRADSTSECRALPRECVSRTASAISLRALQWSAVIATALCVVWWLVAAAPLQGGVPRTTRTTSPWSATGADVPRALFHAAAVRPGLGSACPSSRTTHLMVLSHGLTGAPHNLAVLQRELLQRSPCLQVRVSGPQRPNRAAPSLHSNSLSHTCSQGCSKACLKGQACTC